MEQTTLRDHWGNLAVTISCKGIVFEAGKIWLRMNERNDWELPGGRLDEGEQPEDAIRREIREELDAEISEPALVDVYVWKKSFGTNTHVELVTFKCDVKNRLGQFEALGEAGRAQFKLFSVGEALTLDNLPLPYKRALRKL